MRTLQQIIKKENKTRKESGAFGIKACKESIIKQINSNIEMNKKYNYNLPVSLYVLLEEYVERANNDVFFNDAMVLACWELINNK